MESNRPYGVAISGDVVYVADTDNRTNKKLTTDGKFWNMCGSCGSDNGVCSGPSGLTNGPDGMI